MKKMTPAMKRVLDKLNQYPCATSGQLATMIYHRRSRRRMEPIISQMLCDLEAMGLIDSDHQPLEGSAS